MGVDVNEAGNRIAQLLQPEQPSDSAEVEAETPENTEATTDENLETPETETVTEESEETPTGDTETEPTYTVKVNGEEQEVSLEDLRKGYMMESDYRKKTSEVARQREEAQQKQDALNAKIEEVESYLKLDLDDLNSQENLELKEYDPQAYYEKRDKLEAKAKKLAEMKAESEQSQAERKVADMEKQKELLLTALPEWLDDAKMKSEASLVNQLWNDHGFTEDELNNFTDHRLVLISRKAALYDQLMKAKPEDKIVKTKPKSATPGASSTPEERKAKQVNDVRAKVRKTGNMRDAAAAIKALMK